MSAAVSGKGSFSYDIVGGAQFSSDGTSSVNPNAVVPLSALSSSVTGNVTIDGHTSYANSLRSGYSIVVPTMVRTGTGSITIAAAGDFATLDSVAPGTIYTAGYVADNASGFTAPTLPSGTVSNGLITTPVWATGGGNVTVTPGRDIVGIETPTDTGNQYSNDGSSAGISTGEFWSAWYYVNGNSTGSATAPFDPSAGGHLYQLRHLLPGLRRARRRQHHAEGRSQCAGRLGFAAGDDPIFRWPVGGRYCRHRTLLWRRRSLGGSRRRHAVGCLLCRPRHGDDPGRRQRGQRCDALPDLL
jgi:hypothetical protein